jgi:hypothetical protein
MRFLTPFAVLLVALSALPAAAQWERSNPQLGQSYSQGAPQYGQDDRSGRSLDNDRRRGRGIRITSAFYGVNNQSCQATRPVARSCDGESSCSVRATNRLCGDPVQGVVKALTVSYRCHGRERSVTRPEGRSVNLRCD